MSAFLAGVVRRGAGLASPVAVRPAAGPQQIPMPHPMASPPAESAVEGSRPDAQAAIQPAASTAPLQASSAPLIVQPDVRIEHTTQTQIVPARPLSSSHEETFRAVRPQVAPAERSAVEPRRAPEAAREVSPPAMDVHRQRSEQNRDPFIVQPPPVTAPTAAPGKRDAPETRNIQVKIGKVEIRSSQPPPVIAAPRPAANRGFDQLTLARNYLDRGGR